MSDNSGALLACSGAVGDFILALRVAEALRLAGSSRVAALARSLTASVAVGGSIDEVIDADTGGAHTLHSADAEIPKALREKLAGRGPIVLMAPTERAQIPASRLAALSGSSVIVIDPRPRPGSVEHITDQWLADLRGQGIEAEPGPPRIVVAEEDRAKARRDWLRAAEGKVALIQPGSGGKSKCWPLANFIELAGKLREAGVAADFLLGPVEDDLWGEEKFSALTEDHHVVRGKTLAEAAALVSAADLFIGNDSGIGHLAAAVGIPTLSLFGPTDPRVWRPLGPRVAALGGTTWPTVAEALLAAQSLLRAGEDESR